MTARRPMLERLRLRLAQGRPLGSLRSQLLRWLLIPLVMLVLLDAVFVYRNALDAADMAYDRSLLASTRALAERVSIVGGKVVAEVPYVALDSFETDTLGRIYYKVTGLSGELVSGYDDLPPVPKNVPRSENYPALVRFYHADYHGKPIRIAALLQPVYDDSMRGIALIQVAETLDARRGLSNQILLDTLLWQAAMVLLMGALVWFAVRLVLQPLMRLKTEVETRTLSDLSDVDPTLVHREMRPLVSAMNGAMGRLQQLIASQRRFIADASHQLRTPLTVLKTQAELALRECDRHPDNAHNMAALRDIVKSIASTTDSTVLLANRLLTLARIEHGGENLPMETVSLRALAQQVGLEMAMSAVSRDIDLSLEALDDAPVQGQALLLHELIANLVDNALRYTPQGGNVVLRVRAATPDALHGAVLEVEDSGAGIAPAERERVFTPFYRVASALERNPGGAGLGLAIVRDIAALHGARLELATASNGHGLKVSVHFNAPPTLLKNNI
ncbi:MULTISPECIES: sensor histidine kinase [unclassified Janthinobacterium]|uniref:sensor histidine kinase n=1 Tax=unclassified Janthinobacterium TaxID=2610881 RepID=UPI001619516C|nr:MULTISPECIES: sensor histidine kinase [unclassified Janthinobacterium]MBB5367232.1 two-component system sensor histidine kinase TctE [Janthinobacterium sp. K2C7]MBB5380290.1 two-component system sensor histidine kinase TctE [Janthinobacterium sp. K2Li3]MBB5385614.1 two-component system sensor histidine kinase TctE [Janthinobacterium sp. K2E3]